MGVAPSSSIGIPSARRQDTVTAVLASDSGAVAARGYSSTLHGTPTPHQPQAGVALAGWRRPAGARTAAGRAGLFSPVGCFYNAAMSSETLAQVRDWYDRDPE